jgi:hypothetical protein
VLILLEKALKIDSNSLLYNFRPMSSLRVFCELSTRIKFLVSQMSCSAMCLMQTLNFSTFSFSCSFIDNNFLGDPLLGELIIDLFLTAHRMF